MHVRSWFALVVIAMLSLMLFACDDDFELEDQSKRSISRVYTDLTFFKDGYGRYVYFNGVNLSGSTKAPVEFNPVSYIGRPFDLEDADHHFKILRDLGFNSVRLLLMWEAIEPYAKGEYDEDYLDYIEQVVKKAQEYGIYCLMDMHQDMFSRHVLRFFDDGTGVNGLYDPVERERAEAYGFNNKVGGDGAPRWVVQAALPEKQVGGPNWGLPKYLVDNSDHTSDVLPWTTWFLNIGTSLDINRCYAALFAGDTVWPNYKIDGQNLKEYLQEAYANSYLQVVNRVSKYPNVIGYDVMNEPGALFIMLTIHALFYKEAKSAPSGLLSDEQVTEIFDGYLEDLKDLGMSYEETEIWRAAMYDNDLLPKSLDDIYNSGFMPRLGASSPYAPDLGAVFALNSAFNKNYLQPFYEYVGQKIQAADPDAIIFIEGTTGLSDRGIAGQWAEPMQPLKGIDQYAFAPHKYTDIYPMIGFNMPPRDFEPEEIRYRDYTDLINEGMDSATYSLGNPPVVFGEFGTYYNYGGIEKSVETDYEVASYILDPYYEVFEEKLIHRMLWCYSAHNDPVNGDLWNKEDFSVLDFNGQPRCEKVFSRPYPRFSSGRIVSMRFYSDYHYYEPRPGSPTPYREFYFEMLGKESDAPTEIFVPKVQYADGFYAYISDGRLMFDPDLSILYYYPDDDDPDTVHTLRLRPPYDDYGDSAWDYFFKDDQVLINKK